MNSTARLSLYAVITRCQKQTVVLTVLLCVVTMLMPGLTGCSGRQAAYKPAVAKLMELASQYKKNNQMDKALSRLEAAAELSPETFEVHYNLGVLYTESGQPQQAILPLQSALKINPKHANAYYALGVASMAYADQLEPVATRPAAELKDMGLPASLTAMSAQEAKVKQHEAMLQATEAYQQFLKHALQQDPLRQDVENQIQVLQSKANTL